MRGYRLIWPILVLVALVGCQPTRAATTGRVVLLYGDSIPNSVAAQLQQLASGAGITLDVRTYPGTALCDWLPKMAQDATTYRPGLVVLAFQGDAFTPCMGGDGTATVRDPLAQRVAIWQQSIEQTGAIFHKPIDLVDAIECAPGSVSPMTPDEIVAYNQMLGHEDAIHSSVLSLPQEIQALTPYGVYNPAYRAADGIHLNASGQTRYAAALIAALS